MDKPKLTKFEKDILKTLDPNLGCQYIARDNSDKLFVYSTKPFKDMEQKHWRPRFGGFAFMFPFPSLFKFIKWEDDAPWLIDDLLKLEVEDGKN